MKVMITGAGGLVGRAVAAYCTARGETTVALDHGALDVSDQLKVTAALDRVRPEAVINCAAWTDVDGCELNPERARQVNAGGPELLARACRKVEALFITISTDYVFDGEKDGFYTQRDQPNPQSAYAVSKLEGERHAQTIWARTIIVRSGYIFGGGGTNFLSTLLGSARRGEQLKVITDSFGTPTYARDLAQQLYRLAGLDLPGVYHLVNSGEGASFEDFARVALEHAGLETSLLHPVSMKSLNRPAPRPRNSRLRCLLSEAIGLEPMRPWQDAARDFVLSETSARAV
jgi:dTDP-4-dehydrorhamnose reductase